MALNVKQQAFVSAYLVHKNATQAAKDAGYSEKTAGSIGHELLKKPEIEAAIGGKIEKVAKELDVSVEYILKSLRTVAERCMQGEKVMEFDPASKQMVETGEWKFEHSGANKALELLGRYQKMFTDKMEVDDQSSIAAKLRRFKKNGI